MSMANLYTRISWNFRIIETAEDNEHPRNVGNEEGIAQGKKFKSYFTINGSWLQLELPVTLARDKLVRTERASSGFQSLNQLRILPIPMGRIWAHLERFVWIL